MINTKTVFKSFACFQNKMIIAAPKSQIWCRGSFPSYWKGLHDNSSTAEHIRKGYFK